MALQQAQSTIDTRAIGKPEKLSSERKYWRDWRFIFENYMSLVDSEYALLLDRARETNSSRSSICRKRE